MLSKKRLNALFIPASSNYLHYVKMGYHHRYDSELSD
jgi:hypothetical protein